MRKVLNTDVFYDDINTQFIADSINSKTRTAMVAGVTANNYLAINEVVGSVGCVHAYVSASGASATKALLASGTDYTLSADGRIQLLTDQSANTLVVHYTL